MAIPRTSIRSAFYIYRLYSGSGKIKCTSNSRNFPSYLSTRRSPICGVLQSSSSWYLSTEPISKSGRISGWNFSICVWTPNQGCYGSMPFALVNEISMNEIIRLIRWPRSTSKQQGSLYGMGHRKHPSKLAMKLISFFQGETQFIQPSTDPKVLANWNWKVTALHALLIRDYGSRLWIIQEFLVAKEFILQCSGDRRPSFHFSFFLWLAWSISTDGRGGPGTIKDLASYSQFPAGKVHALARNGRYDRRQRISRLDKTRSRPITLQLLFMFFSDYKGAVQCEDPRDKILGLRSLASGYCKKAVPAQYSLTLEGIP